MQDFRSIELKTRVVETTRLPKKIAHENSSKNTVFLITIKPGF